MYLAKMEAEDKFPWFNLEERAIWKCGDLNNSAFIEKFKGIGLDVDYSIKNIENLIFGVFILFSSSFQV